MEVSPSSQLVFQRTEEVAQSIITLTNHETKTQFYKTKTTAPRTFNVKPIKGLIPPGETAVITVSLHDKSAFHPDRRGDKFLIEFVVVPDDIANDEKAAADYVEAAKLAKKSGKAGVDIGMVKLNAVYADMARPAPNKTDYVEKDKYSRTTMSVTSLNSNASVNSRKAQPRKKIYDDEDDECECCPVVFVLISNRYN
ncbi:hypothetical protein HDV06_006705 [Boothiomyces sp. JEL0866]|nr:hypothetical protein HDV06_006705 [Boothiomyces sp. JEL0866]